MRFAAALGHSAQKNSGSAIIPSNSFPLSVDVKAPPGKPPSHIQLGRRNADSSKHMSKFRSERRIEVRFKASQPVSLTVLGGTTKAVMEGCITDISPSGLRLRVPEPLALGAPIKVDAQDVLLLAEVVRCEPDRGAYNVGLQVHKSVAASELIRLNNALLHEDFWTIDENAQAQGSPCESIETQPVCDLRSSTIKSSD